MYVKIIADAKARFSTQHCRFPTCFNGRILSVVILEYFINADELVND